LSDFVGARDVEARLRNTRPSSWFKQIQSASVMPSNANAKQVPGTEGVFRVRVSLLGGLAKELDDPPSLGALPSPRQS
jgi:hypothetical protein